MTPNQDWNYQATYHHPVYLAYHAPPAPYGGYAPPHHPYTPTPHPGYRNYGAASSHGPFRQPRYDEFDHIPSSDPIDDPEDITLFPRLSNWLQELDQGPRGGDDHKYAKFAPDFEWLKFKRIVDICTPTIDTAFVTSICTDMAPGTVSNILTYARADVEKIQRKEKKRLCEARYAPTRYP